MNRDIVSMVILEALPSPAGPGTIVGVVLAAILAGFAVFGLSLVNVPGIVVSLTMGVLLIAVVGTPRVQERLAHLRLMALAVKP